MINLKKDIIKKLFTSVNSLTVNASFEETETTYQFSTIAVYS